MAKLLAPMSRISGSPEVLRAIGEPHCNLAIWQRTPFADFGPLVEGTPQDLRFTCDVAGLPALLAKAQAEGRPIREVVLRTSNGGALIAGEWLQGVIRTNGLNTIVSGHCISSCSIMQSGGVERYLAGDLPLVDSVQYSVLRSGPPNARLVSDAPAQLRSTTSGSPRWFSTQT